MTGPEEEDYLNIRVYKKDKPRMRKLADRLIKREAKREPMIKLIKS